MIYQKSVLTLADTTMEQLVRTDFSLNKGLLYQLDVWFPPGSSGLLKLQIHEKHSLIYPSTEDEWFTGDNMLISFQDTRLMTLPPYKFVLKTINQDIKFNHTVVVRVGLLSKDELLIRYLPKDITGLLEKYIAEKDENEQTMDEAEKEFLQSFLGD